MQVKATTSFSGMTISMARGEVIDTASISDDVLADLLQAGYVEEVKAPKATQKKVASKGANNESKRNHN